MAKWICSNCDTGNNRDIWYCNGCGKKYTKIGDEWGLDIKKIASFHSRLTPLLKKITSFKTSMIG